MEYYRPEAGMCWMLLVNWASLDAFSARFLWHGHCIPATCLLFCAAFPSCCAQALWTLCGWRPGKAFVPVRLPNATVYMVPGSGSWAVHGDDFFLLPGAPVVNNQSWMAEFFQDGEHLICHHRFFPTQLQGCSNLAQKRVCGASKELESNHCSWNQRAFSAYC